MFRSPVIVLPLPIKTDYAGSFKNKKKTGGIAGQQVSNYPAPKAAL
jgi:hypothetical protein